jgi:hypothetical protein
MNLLIQHEYYKELLESGPRGRDVEGDGISSDQLDEKVFS